MNDSVKRTLSTKMVSIETRVNIWPHKTNRARASKNGSKACTGEEATLLPTLALVKGSLLSLTVVQGRTELTGFARALHHLFCRAAAPAGLPPATHSRARAEKFRGSHLAIKEGNPPIA